MRSLAWRAMPEMGPGLSGSDNAGAPASVNKLMIKVSKPVQGSGSAIEPAPSGIPRPFWSVMIPTYNPQADYLEQTLRSVLAQDPGPEQTFMDTV